MLIDPPTTSHTHTRTHARALFKISSLLIQIGIDSQALVEISNAFEEDGKTTLQDSKTSTVINRTEKTRLICDLKRSFCG
jgi:hypothetical protein